MLPVELRHRPIRKALDLELLDVFRGQDLVHVEYPTEGWGNSVLPSFIPMGRRHGNAGAKLLVTLHEWSRMNPLRRASIRPLVAAADGFIFVSEQERKAFLATARGAARKKPTWVVPIGVNVEVATLARAEVGAFRCSELRGEFDLLLTHFGFIHAGKQPEKLLDAMQVLGEKGRSPKLTFIGDFQADKADERRAFLADIAARGLQDSVRCLGFVEDARVAGLHMAACDASISLFDDGLSPRRGSFWYATQHGCSVVTTTPSDWSDFSELATRLQPPHVQFIPPDGTGDRLAELLQGLPAYEAFAYPPLPVPTWASIAQRHAEVYEELLAR